MPRSCYGRLFSLVSALLFAVVPSVVLAQDSTPVDGGGALVPLVTGLTNPRGFTWDANGAIYLALAGNGGDTQLSLSGTPFPFFNSASSSIAKIAGGCTQTVAKGFPSLLWKDMGWVWGVMDVAILDGQLYALSGGGGLGLDQQLEANGVYRVNDDGSHALVADLSTWFAANPPKFVAPDYDPNGSLFDMEAGDGALWVSEAVGGRLLKIIPNGTITLVADLSEGHMVPTGIALASDGGVYVGFETSAPFTNGQSKIIEVAADGSTKDVWTGLTMVTDVTTGPDGSIYVAEMSTGNTDAAPYVQPGSGTILHRTADGTVETVASGLDFPVGLGIGPDGAVYVDGPAYGADNGEGWLGRIGGEPMATSVACGTPVA